jgi:hypothetical protein
MFDTKKGKYSLEENERIIEKMNEGFLHGIRERDTLKELSVELNRGFAGIMSHVRKLRNKYPERFIASTDEARRMNSWTDEEEHRVIHIVNRFLEQGKSLSTAIAHLEKELQRTQGAIYQRIYTLRRKYPDRFSKAPESRPRRRRRLEDWQLQRSTVHPNGHSLAIETKSKWTDSSHETDSTLQGLSEHEMVIKAFESRYGKASASTRKQLLRLMEQYGHTRVSIGLFTLQEDKEFPAMIIRFLKIHLDKKLGSVQ